VLASIRAGNSAPPVPKVVVTPAAAKVGAALKCEVDVPATDVDAEPLRVHYAWMKDGAPSPVGLELPSLPAGLVRKGERWRCEAWSDDGLALSARAGADATVKNSRASAPMVTLEPEVPGTDDELICRVSGDATDADGDRLQYKYQWTKNGKAVPAGADPSRVPAEKTQKGDLWRCEVSANDGEEQSPPSTVEAKVRNSPPGAVAIRLKPGNPVAGEPLSCDIVDPAKDPDGDAVTYRITWYKDGVAQSFSFASAQVPGRLVKASEMWSCSALATDGQLEGPPGGSETVAVQKSADGDGRMTLINR
jgi:hypothetical protein